MRASSASDFASSASISARRECFSIYASVPRESHFRNASSLAGRRGEERLVVVVVMGNPFVIGEWLPPLTANIADFCVHGHGVFCNAALQRRGKGFSEKEISLRQWQLCDSLADQQ